jgi:hypothetical protein
MTSERGCYVYIVPPDSTEFVTAGRFNVSLTSDGEPVGQFLRRRYSLSRSHSWDCAKRMAAYHATGGRQRCRLRSHLYCLPLRRIFLRRSGIDGRFSEPCLSADAKSSAAEGHDICYSRNKLKRFNICDIHYLHKHCLIHDLRSWQEIY